MWVLWANRYLTQETAVVGHETRKLGLGLGEELAQFHMIGSFKHQRAVCDSNSKGRVFILVGRTSG